MDNSLYSPNHEIDESDVKAFQPAILELKRVLRPGGRLLLTVPFGKYKNFRIFQQFDKELLENAASVFNASKQENYFYRYTKNGWQISSANECADCDYSNHAISVFNKSVDGVQPEKDYASAARSVACVIWQK